MPRKTHRPTLEQHVEIGNAIKDYRSALLHVINITSPFLLAKETDKLVSFFNYGATESIKSELEDIMFTDYPWLTNDALSVYYHDDERTDAAALMDLAHKAERI